MGDRNSDYCILEAVVLEAMAIPVGVGAVLSEVIPLSGITR